jgi:hypothetical protein
MIQINKIIPPTLDIYEPSGKLLGTVNEYEFLDIRVQIKKAQVFGYYLIFNGKKVRIDKNGELEDYPLGLLDTMSGFYCELI